MLDFITEPISVWERLKETDKPILLYGMGNGADKILAELDRREIPCAGVFASDGFVRGHSFHDFQVMSYSQAKERFGDAVILLAFAVYRPEMLEWMNQLNGQHEFYAPDVPVIGEKPFSSDDLQTHAQEIQCVYDLLADEESKRVFSGVLNFKLSGKIRYLNEVTSSVDEAYRTLLCPQRGERYLDLGAYNGDTVREFIGYQPDYREIIAFEPDEKNFRKLTNWLKQEEIRDCMAYCRAVWSEPTLLPFQKKAGRNSALGEGGTATVEADSIDHLLNGEPIDLIKMDVEGAEAEAIQGGAQTLQRYMPKLNIALYHRNEDIFRLPLLICKINPSYRLYLRHHPYIPAWETNLYAIKP